MARKRIVETIAVPTPYDNRMRSWISRLIERARPYLHRFPAPPCLRSLGELVYRAFLNFSRDDGSHMAAGVAYYAFFSLFPLILATIAIGGYFVDDIQVETILLDLLNRELPGIGDSPLIRGNIEGLAAARGAFSLFALGGLIWAGRAIFGAVHRVLNRAWRVSQPPHFVLYQVGQVAGSVGVTLLFVATAFLGTIVRAVAAQAELLFIWETIINTVSTLLSAVLFLILYKFIPDAKVRWRDAVPAGVVAGIAFEITQLGFSFYLANISTLDLVYGSITTVVLLMLFLYLVSLILVWGAELSSEIRRTDDAGLLNLRKEIRPVPGGLARVSRRGGRRQPEASHLPGEASAG